MVVNVTPASVSMKMKFVAMLTNAQPQRLKVIYAATNQRASVQIL